MNSTKFSYFTLSPYFDSGLLEYVSFMTVMSLYVLILCSNLLLIVVICVNRSLHEPMYMFLCSLFVNELYGSTGLFPFLLLQILSDIHTVSASACFLQIFCVYTYANVEICNLAVMSYDRYLAICCPLQYNMHMTHNRTVILIALTWLYPFLAVIVLISLSASLQLCGNIINKVYCDNYSVVKLACSDTTVNNVYGMIYTTATICVVILIFYSYIRILKVCFSGSKQTRQKAVSTCTPHLASLLNFSFGAFFEIVSSRFDMKHLPDMLRMFLSLYWLTCQPLFNPVLYGLNLTKIRIIFKNLMFGKI
uniref:olfactory receptor 52E4-like n=1 Tax=Epinephelus lanceolatus TaxID=310571 RepID=UPI0014466CCE|nr:olfactory receptor 52E4-like [Epinephelus lanceolatus]